MSFTKTNAPRGGVAAQGTRTLLWCSAGAPQAACPRAGDPAPPGIPLPQAAPCPAPQLDGCLDPSPASRGLGKAMKVSVDDLKQHCRSAKRQGVSIK